MKKIISKLDFLGKLTPTQRRFVRGLVAEIISAAFAFVAYYLTNDVKLSGGVFVGLTPILQAWSKKLRGEDRKTAERVFLPF